MLCLMYDFFSANTRTIYLVIVSNNIYCIWRFLYQVSTSEKVVYIFSKSKLLIKTLYFKFRANKESRKEHCGGHL